MASLDEKIAGLGLVGGLGSALVGYVGNFNPENLATAEKMVTYGLITGAVSGIYLVGRAIYNYSQKDGGSSSGSSDGGGGCGFFAGFFGGCGGGGCGGGCGGGGCGGGCGGS
ncbi:MAG: hypothetical protein WCV90_07895 [Candidatus Woesearchaeota archaeon]|jgi:hypothetical protein